MIKFYGVTENLFRNLLVLKDWYPNDVLIEDYSEYLKTVIVFSGVPVILKHYGFDNQFRFEIGSYLSDTISDHDYVAIEIA